MKSHLPHLAVSSAPESPTYDGQHGRPWIQALRRIGVSGAALLALGPGAGLGFAQGSSAPEIDVLTLDSSRTFVCSSTDFNVRTGNVFSNVRMALQDPARFGNGGVVMRTVNFLPSVPEITSDNLDGAEVVLISLNSIPVTACELLELRSFVDQGGGLFVFSNSAADRFGPTFGATVSGQVGNGGLTIEDANSELIAGPFGSVTGPLGGLGFHHLFDQVGPMGNSVLSTTGTVMAEFDLGLGRACLMADEEWCANIVLNGCLVGQLPEAQRERLFLNAFASVVPPTSFAYNGTPQCIGEQYCDPASVNSRGIPATIWATGSETATANQITLHAEGMPFQEMGFFLNGTGSGMYSPPLSDGTICLIGGGIGRYNGNITQPGTGQVLSSGPTGSFFLPIDLTNTPTPFTPVAISAGETWRFQAWYRDGSSNNFTDAITIQFQ